MPFEPLKVDIDPVFKGQTPKNETPAPQSGVASVLNNQEYTPSVNETRQALDEINHNEKKSLVRTYKDDIASAIQANHLSSINIAIAENEKMHSQMTGEQTSDTTNKASKLKKILGILLFLIIIIIVLVGSNYIFKKQSMVKTVDQTQEQASIISADYRDELNINSIIRERFATVLSSRINDIKIPNGSIYSPKIVVGDSTTKRPVTTSELLALTGFNIPDIVARNLAADFMVGMYSFDPNQPFLIFKTKSFESTYAGMVEWELNLEKDFAKLFRLNGGNEIGGTIAILNASSTHKFQDGVVSNQDVRLLRDANGKIMFIYNILNKDTIIITTGDQALKELILRINKEKGAKR